jgi:hypothetical protein
MTHRQLSSFLDALSSGRRPRGFKAEPDDVEVLRTAITLSGARPRDAAPTDQFVSDLQQELTDLARSSDGSNVYALKMRRVRNGIVAVAASLVLVGGTFVATKASNHPSAPTAALSVPHGTDLLTGTFETTDGHVLGQIVLYRGHPSWVFMNVDVANSNSRIICKLETDNGSTVASGTFGLHDGRGQFARSVPGNINHLRGATLFTPAGAVVGSATFA